MMRAEGRTEANVSVGARDSDGRFSSQIPLGPALRNNSKALRSRSSQSLFIFTLIPQPLNIRAGPSEGVTVPWVFLRNKYW
jgi:hypothetical protein